MKTLMVALTAGILAGGAFGDSAADLIKKGYAFDKLSNATNYAAVSPNFAKAVAFLTRADLKRLELGKYEIDGKNVFAMVQDAKLKVPADCKVEMHRQYADIQMTFGGTELIGAGPLPKGVAFPPFKEGSDAVLVKALLPTTPITGETFGIFLPGAPHEPCMSDGEPRVQRKICIKVSKDW